MYNGFNLKLFKDHNDLCTDMSPILLFIVFKSFLFELVLDHHSQLCQERKATRLYLQIGHTWDEWKFRNKVQITMYFDIEYFNTKDDKKLSFCYHLIEVINLV